jgi:hypothetical protein
MSTISQVSFLCKTLCDLHIRFSSRLRISFDNTLHFQLIKRQSSSDFTDWTEPDHQSKTEGHSNIWNICRCKPLSKRTERDYWIVEVATSSAVTEPSTPTNGINWQYFVLSTGAMASRHLPTQFPRALWTRVYGRVLHLLRPQGKDISSSVLEIERHKRQESNLCRISLNSVSSWHRRVWPSHWVKSPEIAFTSIAVTLCRCFCLQNGEL